VTDLAAARDGLRPLMFSIVYRMLGSVVDAEDVVQDAFLDMHRSTLDGTVIESVDAFAATVTTRLAVDALRSARRRREQYVGPWLPEPLVESEESDPSWRLGRDETVSMAFPDREAIVVEPVQTNGQPGARFLSRDASLLGVMSLEIEDGRIRSLTNQINPDKLRHLGRVGDLAGLMQQAGRTRAGGRR
jgi:hypothetical protein